MKLPIVKGLDRVQLPRGGDAYSDLRAVITDYVQVCSQSQAHEGFQRLRVHPREWVSDQAALTLSTRETLTKDFEDVQTNPTGF